MIPRVAASTQQAVLRLAVNGKFKVTPKLVAGNHHLRIAYSTTSSRSSRVSTSFTTTNSVEQKKRYVRNSACNQQADATAAVSSSRIALYDFSQESKAKNSLTNRFIITAEVTVSKIFPAGFGWQTASIIAGSNLGYATDSINFALTTGVGDAVGVFGGHMTYYALKKALLNSTSINLTQEMHTGILLGCAAFCSGTVWQPAVNALQGADLPFTSVMAGTWVACGTAFYLGLRAGRAILSDALSHVEAPTTHNAKTDLILSTAIGGAAGFFVDTDATYLPEQNFLLSVVGIQEGTSNLMGYAIAGSSTSLGFGVAQTCLNFAISPGKCWND